MFSQDIQLLNEKLYQMKLRWIQFIMNLQKGVFHNLLLTSPLEGKEDCILLIETAHSRSGYFWTIPILEVNQYHPWRWFWVGRCGGWAHWSKGCQKWNSTIRICVQTLFFSKKVLYKIPSYLQIVRKSYSYHRVFPEICKYYRVSIQHTQSFPLRSIGFLCDSYSPFP